MISAYLTKMKPNYTKYTSIVNLSGMGKSYTVDKLLKKIITIPMCLYGDFTQGFFILISTTLMLIYIMIGFPPPDRELQIWLLGGQRRWLDEE